MEIKQPEERVTCDVCGRRETIDGAVAGKWVSQLFMVERAYPPAKITTAELHCLLCAEKFDQNISLCTVSATSEVDIN